MEAPFVCMGVRSVSLAQLTHTFIMVVLRKPHFEPFRTREGLFEYFPDLVLKARFKAPVLPDFHEDAFLLSF